MKALVIDDDIVSRMALMDLLAAYGVFALHEAADGEAAWTLLAAGLRPVICFCDVRMPRLSGIDLLQRMKADPALAGVPFVLVSSSAERETVIEAVRLGALGYIRKPLHAADARAHLEKIFRATLDRLAEHPVATMKRLSIGPDRLATYLGAFGAQLAGARSDIARLLGDAAAGADAAAGDARLRVDAVHTGCMTLGLWHAADIVDGTRAGVLDVARVAAALVDVADAVARQAGRVGAGVGLGARGALA
jgi:two-component system chemotaxis response regulator CheY